jgi:hypothetical protein
VGEPGGGQQRVVPVEDDARLCSEQEEGREGEGAASGREGAVTVGSAGGGWWLGEGGGQGGTVCGSSSEGARTRRNNTTRRSLATREEEAPSAGAQDACRGAAGGTAAGDRSTRACGSPQACDSRGATHSGSEPFCGVKTQRHWPAASASCCGCESPGDQEEA